MLMRPHCRVGMIIARFFPREGGAETQCRQLSARLISKGHSVFVLTQRLPGTAAFEMIQGIPVHRVGLPLSGPAGSLSFLAAGAFWLLSRRGLYDILHAHIASSPAVLASLIGRSLSVPVLVKFAGSRATGDIALSRNSWYGRIKLKIIARSAMCIAPSREIAGELRQAGMDGRRISVVPNGVDTARFSPAQQQSKGAVRKSLGIPDAAFVAVFSGRFERGKNIELLISAWKDALALSSRKDMFLLLIGGGSLEPALKDLAGGDDNILFTGWSDDPERYLAASDAFVLPSSGEGMPNTLLEAMASGCACLATRIGGVTDVIDEGKNGILFSTGDRAGLASLLADLAPDPGRRAALGAEARKKICDSFSLPSVTDRYLRLYSDTLDLKGDSR